MGTQEDHLRKPSNGHHGHHEHHGHGIKLPVIGFVLSIVLTLISLWSVMNRVMSVTNLIALILILAVIQIFIQLFFFMHVTESKGHPWHAWMLGLGLIFVVCIIAGSIWILSFGAETY